MKFEEHLLQIKNQNITEDNILSKVFDREQIFKISIQDLKKELINLYIKEKLIYTEIYVLEMLNDIEIKNYIKLNFPNIKIENIIIDINNKKYKKQNINLSDIFLNIFSGVIFIQFNNIQNILIENVSTKNTSENIDINNKIESIYSSMLVVTDLVSYFSTFLGIFFMLKGIYLLYRYSTNMNEEVGTYIKIKSQDESKPEFLNYFIFIDNLLSNNNLNIDSNIFSLIFYEEEYISYILKNYKYNLIDVIYEKECVSNINLQLKSNKEFLNKFCIFLIEHDLLESKDYDQFSIYVNKYSTNKTLLNFIKNEKVFTSSLFNKSLNKISL